MTSLKCHFIENFSTDSLKFDGRRQINAGEGTESFSFISTAVFELSIKFGRGRQNSPPPLAWRALILGYNNYYVLFVLVMFAGSANRLSCATNDDEHYYAHIEVLTSGARSAERSSYLNNGQS